MRADRPPARIFVGHAHFCEFLTLFTLNAHSFSLNALFTITITWVGRATRCIESPTTSFCQPKCHCERQIVSPSDIVSTSVSEGWHCHVGWLSDAHNGTRADKNWWEGFYTPFCPTQIMLLLLLLLISTLEHFRLSLPVKKRITLSALHAGPTTVWGGRST